MIAADARIWDRLAKRYDMVVRIFDTSYPVVREHLREDLAGASQVLELAAGTGQFTADLARTADDLLTTDFSPEMVKELGSRFKGFANVVARQMNVYEIDSPDQTFDAVFCANLLHLLDTPNLGLSEMRRVLKEDGLLITPTFLHGVDPWRRALSTTMSTFAPFVANKYRLVDIESVIRNAGFTILKSEELPGIFPLAYVVAQKTKPL